MKRLIGLSTLALAALLATGAGAQTRTYFGFQIGVTNAPPHRFAYMPSPDLYYEPSSRVYVVENGYDDWDMFRYGSSWYACDGDYWYRANSYRGPFYVCDVRVVPRAIFYVPRDHWRRYPRPLATWRNRGHGGDRYVVRDRGQYDDRRWSGRDVSWRSNDRGDWRTNDRGDWNRGDRPPGWDRGNKNGWKKGGNGRGHSRGHGHDD